MSFPLRALSVILSIGSMLHAQTESPNWPSFHGPRASGVADGHALPTTWNVETGENVRWSTEIPGLSHSSPITWGDKLFVATAVKPGDPAQLKVGLYGSIAPVANEGVHTFEIHCLDRNTGERLWRQVVFEGEPAIPRHPKGSHAASTLATDGNVLVAFFGSEGLHAYDLEGNKLWSRSFGRLDSGFFMMPGAQWGWASSPIVHEGKVIVQVDVQESEDRAQVESGEVEDRPEDFVAVFDARTGGLVWRTPRDDYPTWSTPCIAPRGDRWQVIVNGYKHVGGYDFATGAELWKVVGGGDIPVPTPIVFEDLVFVTSAHGRLAPVYAIRLDANGLVTTEDTAQMPWSQTKLGCYMQTPLVYEGLLYRCRDNGILYCQDPRTGEDVYAERVGSGMGFTASIVAGDGKIYLTAEDGEIHVVRAGRTYEKLAVNVMGRECMATPAIVDGTLYVRTRDRIWALGS